jgi:hypothetical protein
VRPDLFEAYAVQKKIWDEEMEKMEAEEAKEEEKEGKKKMK